MNKRKPVDYTELYTLLDEIIAGTAAQMEQYTAIGKAVSMRSEKGARQWQRRNICSRTGRNSRAFLPGICGGCGLSIRHMGIILTCWNLPCRSAGHLIF